MFDRLFENMKTGATWGLVIGIIVAAIILIVKGSGYLKEKENEKRTKEKIQNGIDEVKTETLKWSSDQKSKFMDYLSEEYNSLEAYTHKTGIEYADKTIISVYVNNELKHYEIDLKGIRDLYLYLEKRL